MTAKRRRWWHRWYARPWPVVDGLVTDPADESYHLTKLGAAMARRRLLRNRGDGQVVVEVGPT